MYTDIDTTKSNKNYIVCCFPCKNELSDQARGINKPPEAIYLFK